MESQYYMPYYLNGDVWLLAYVKNLNAQYNVPGYARQGERSILYRALSKVLNDGSSFSYLNVNSIQRAVGKVKYNGSTYISDKSAKISFGRQTAI